MCKFILLFSFIVLLLILLLVFFFKLAPDLGLSTGTSPEIAQPNVSALHDRALELGKQPAARVVK